MDSVLSGKMMSFDGLRRIELVEINPAARHLAWMYWTGEIRRHFRAFF
jgi:hypothetical protein